MLISSAVLELVSYKNSDKTLLNGNPTWLCCSCCSSLAWTFQCQSKTTWSSLCVEQMKRKRGKKKKKRERKRGWLFAMGSCCAAKLLGNTGSGDVNSVITFQSRGQHSERSRSFFPITSWPRFYLCYRFMSSASVSPISSTQASKKVSKKPKIGVIYLFIFNSAHDVQQKPAFHWRIMLASLSPADLRGSLTVQPLTLESLELRESWQDNKYICIAVAIQG